MIQNETKIELQINYFSNMDHYSLKLIIFQNNTKHKDHLFPASVGRFWTSAGLSFSLLLSLFLADGVLDLDLLPLGDFSLGDLLRLPFGERGDLDLSDFPVPGLESGAGVC